jgi:hypothetical protein
MQVLDRRKAMAIPPLWRLAFRPFFLGGCVLALLVVPLWLAVFSGRLSAWQPAGRWLAWHRHELLFGFGLAIIAGFLLTAVQTWTGTPGLSGKRLAALALVWLGARLAWLVDAPLPLLTALELAFALGVAALMGLTLWRVRQKRNYPIVLVLLLLAAADGLSVYGLVQHNEGLQRQSVLTGLWLVAAMMGLIGGRVIPFFTQRGLSRVDGVAPWPWLDRLLLAGSALVALLYAFGPALAPSVWIGLLFAALAVGHGIRLGAAAVVAAPGLRLAGGGVPGHGAVALRRAGESEPGGPQLDHRRHGRVDPGDDRPRQPGPYRAPPRTAGGHDPGIYPFEPGVPEPRPVGAAVAVRRAVAGGSVLDVGLRSLRLALWADAAEEPGGWASRMSRLGGGIR